MIFFRFFFWRAVRRGRRRVERGVRARVGVAVSAPARLGPRALRSRRSEIKCAPGSYWVSISVHCFSSAEKLALLLPPLEARRRGERVGRGGRRGAAEQRHETPQRVPGASSAPRITPPGRGAPPVTVSVPSGSPGTPSSWRRSIEGMALPQPEEAASKYAEPLKLAYNRAVQALREGFSSSGGWDFHSKQRDVLIYRKKFLRQGGRGVMACKGVGLVPAPAASVIEVMSNLQFRPFWDELYDRGYTVEEVRPAASPSPSFPPSLVRNTPAHPPQLPQRARLTRPRNENRSTPTRRSPTWPTARRGQSGRATWW